MNQEQLALVLATQGPAAVADPTCDVKFFRTVSGARYDIHPAQGAAGRYTVILDPASGLAIFTPVSPQTAGPSIVPQIDYVDYVSIEAVSLFPPTS